MTQWPEDGVAPRFRRQPRGRGGVRAGPRVPTAFTPPSPLRGFRPSRGRRAGRAWPHASLPCHPSGPQREPVTPVSTARPTGSTACVPLSQGLGTRSHHVTEEAGRAPRQGALGHLTPPPSSVDGGQTRAATQALRSGSRPAEALGEGAGARRGRGGGVSVTARCQPPGRGSGSCTPAGHERTVPRSPSQERGLAPRCLRTSPPLP